MDILLSPAILSFVLGMLAAAVRSNLEIPEVLSKGMAIYLMTAIGLKGGVEVSTSGVTTELVVAGLTGICLSFLLPIPAFWAMRRLAKLDTVNAGAIAAHYGSVSVVTFVTGAAILEASGMPVAGYMVAVLAMMEAPAIITGIWLARRSDGSGAQSLGHQVSHAVRDGAVVLLLGSFAVGLIVGTSGFEPIQPVFKHAFAGVLCLFLLDMGLVAARHLMGTRSVTPTIAAMAVVLAVINGTVGVVAGSVIGLDAGSAAALGILAGSASYIAAPAAIRLALPEADIGLPLAMALAITFPFNVLVGIPIFTTLARLLT
ncbi:sodium-dependent bicarbonate transport family permease [Pelagibacterium luteolum]|uniref:Sodium-dependent bicarbonate transport family permease n=1 Tax=Pelagibacterium luteolum TaxID=440168 RepID=A0A1G8AT17_9HYPH|nr:sodium-dependent bicarbonate transport family permease [Pelagibacterium luteolum]SDH24087.1 hypothetical protein SAMN04487974_1401 [Pelagibacterium luteolum]